MLQSLILHVWIILGNHLLFYSSYVLPNITSIAVAALNAHVIIMPNTNQRTRSTVEDVGFATQSKMSQ
jgi:hypothetical protein